MSPFTVLAVGIIAFAVAVGGAVSDPSPFKVGCTTAAGCFTVVNIALYLKQR